MGAHITDEILSEYPNNRNGLMSEPGTISVQLGEHESGLP